VETHPQVLFYKKKEYEKNKYEKKKHLNMVWHVAKVQAVGE
jgi:hypothetical protein